MTTLLSEKAPDHTHVRKPVEWQTVVPNCPEFGFGVSEIRNLERWQLLFDPCGDRRRDCFYFAAKSPVNRRFAHPGFSRQALNRDPCHALLGKQAARCCRDGEGDALVARPTRRRPEV